jgi:hypothetical protein
VDETARLIAEEYDALLAEIEDRACLSLKQKRLDRFFELDVRFSNRI